MDDGRAENFAPERLFFSLSFNRQLTRRALLHAYAVCFLQILLLYLNELYRFRVN